MTNGDLFDFLHIIFSFSVWKFFFYPLPNRKTKNQKKTKIISQGIYCCFFIVSQTKKKSKKWSQLFFFLIFFFFFFFIFFFFFGKNVWGILFLPTFVFKSDYYSAWKKKKKFKKKIILGFFLSFFFFSFWGGRCVIY